MVLRNKPTFDYWRLSDTVDKLASMGVLMQLFYKTTLKQLII